jgi:hypothetical protein
MRGWGGEGLRDREGGLKDGLVVMRNMHTSQQHQKGNNHYKITTR